MGAHFITFKHSPLWNWTHKVLHGWFYTSFFLLLLFHSDHSFNCSKSAKHIWWKIKNESEYLKPEMPFAIKACSWMHKWMTHCCLPVAIWCRGGCPESVFVCVRVTWCDCHSVRQQTEASFSNPRWAVAYKELTQREEGGKKKNLQLKCVLTRTTGTPSISPWANIKRDFTPS